MLFRVGRELGVVESDPTMDLGLPARRPPAPRPLTDAEVERCRAASLYDFDGTRLPAAWALAEAGVRTGELARVTVGDVDVDGPGLEVPGCRSAMPRRVELTEWGVPQVGRRIATLRGAHPHQPLVYEGDGSDKSKQAASCIAISVTLARAGFGDDPLVRPVSVAAWAGRRVFEETGRVEDAAVFLGMRSFDRTARLIGLDVPAARAC
jgi:integrase/recombinase XerC